ncbi:hypothetical protein HR45_03595 [Shewanella mangrovi]|uniref:histidine kinase n=1 Tax=Shewanella mangrovi TaxID=1515746 RepID=A0A094JKD5_9GAMM|nr:HAMP domain-containing sensor histidine kinase [Shewanella mangrovi]KFZ38524.1 hypothetical protein HR45_03595 [Shewanella mangrovi]
MFTGIDGKGRVRLNSLVLLIAVLTLAVLSALLIYNIQVSGKNRSLIAKQSDVAHRTGLMVVQELGELEDFIRMLSINGVIQQSLAIDKPFNRFAMQDEFSKLGEHIDNLLQVRWLDGQGNEQVRVDVEAQRAFIIDRDELQYKGDRYYFQEGMTVTPPLVYLSPIDLNVEHQQIVIPFEPTVRISLQTGAGDGLRKGLLIINYNLGPLLARVAKLSNAETQVEITNEAGYWLVNPNDEKKWGLDLANPNMNISQLNPLLWQHMTQANYFIGQQIGARLISYQLESLTNTGGVWPDRKVNIVVSTDAAIVKSVQQQASWPAIIAGGIIFVLGLGFVVRDYFSRMSILALSNRLKEDRDALAAMNQRLDTNLRQMNLIKDDLAESKRLSSLGMMVAGISHEMNTPVGGAILTVSEIKQEYQKLQVSLQRGLTRKVLDDFMQHMQASIELTERNLTQANTIIQSFKRLTLTRVEDEFIQIPLKQLVDDMVRGLMPLIKKSNVVVSVDIDDNVRVLSQPGVLSQVLQNLLLNAVEHGFNETIHGHIRIRYRSLLRHHAISVIDDGCGIPEHLIESLFDPFVTTRRDKKHTGLGLHLVFQWVTQCLYGEIKVERLKIGSSFEISLPVDPVPYAQAHARDR